MICDLVLCVTELQGMTFFICITCQCLKCDLINDHDLKYSWRIKYLDIKSMTLTLSMLGMNVSLIFNGRP